jgi:predicted transcriptional regulator
MNVILSIRPTFCQSIFEGKKVYEYRKRVFKRTDIDKVYIYATKPICRIVGYFTIDTVIEDKKYNMWEKHIRTVELTKSILMPTSRTVT